MKHLLKWFVLTMLCLSLIACNRSQKNKDEIRQEENQEEGLLPEEGLDQEEGLLPEEELNQEEALTSEEEVTQENQAITENIDESSGEVSKTTATPPKKSIITSERFERELLNKEGNKTLLRGEFTYPQLQNIESFPSIDKINKEIKENTEAEFNKSFKEGSQYVKGFYTNPNEGFQYPFVTEQKFEVTHNQDHIVSFKISSYSDFGGSHPNLLQSAYTYDVRTGDLLKASHFIGKDEADVKAIVGQTFYTIASEQPDAFYPNALEILSKGEFEFGFYIRDDSIIFFINPYVIAPSAGGIQETGVLLR